MSTEGLRNLKMVASLGAGISCAINGQKHNLDPGVLPCTTLYDFLRGRTTYTVILPLPLLMWKSIQCIEA